MGFELQCHSTILTQRRDQFELVEASTFVVCQGPASEVGSLSMRRQLDWLTCGDVAGAAVGMHQVLGECRSTEEGGSTA